MNIIQAIKNEIIWANKRDAVQGVKRNKKYKFIPIITHKK